MRWCPVASPYQEYQSRVSTNKTVVKAHDLMPSVPVSFLRGLYVSSGIGTFFAWPRLVVGSMQSEISSVEHSARPQWFASSALYPCTPESASLWREAEGDLETFRKVCKHTVDLRHSNSSSERSLLGKIAYQNQVRNESLCWGLNSALSSTSVNPKPLDNSLPCIEITC